jgi:ribosomal protein L11 methyltransferase
VEEAEIVRARLLELVPRGLEEVAREEGVELAVYVVAAAEAEIVRAFPQAVSAAVEPGWETRWREFHRPVRAGGLWIGPPWEDAPAGELAVVIDPGQAFGTGAHATTRACIELLATERPASVLDAGCGSGVVAVAAAKLGHRPVIAVDSDPLAIEAARVNAACNRADVDVHRLDVLRDELPRADLLVANIELGIVEALLGRCRAARAITSGYLAHERARAPGWSAVRALELDGWAAELLERRDGPRGAERLS